MKRNRIFRGMTALTLCGALLAEPTAAAVSVTVEASDSGATADTAQAGQKKKHKIPAALPLPDKLSGNYIADLIAVAQSQVGYKSSNRWSVYGVWAGAGGRPWCSKFVSWCGANAGIPQEIFPLKKSSPQFRAYFSKLGRYYKVNTRKRHKDCDSYAAGTMQLSDILPGDILLVETDGVWKDGPDHTAIVVSVSADRVTCVEGNYDGKVRYKDRTGEDIHGVCRPDYGCAQPTLDLTQNSLAAPEITSVRGNLLGICVKWSAVNGADGYYIYRRAEHGGWERISVASAKHRKYIDEVVENNVRYSYRVRAFSQDGVGTLSDAKRGIWLETPNIVMLSRTSDYSGITVEWKRLKNVSGYQIQYARNYEFTKGKSRVITVPGEKRSRRTIRGLNPKKAYWIRVRAYRKLAGKSYHSPWSWVCYVEAEP